jgi:hypothetical protein
VIVNLGDFDQPVQSEQQGGRAAGLENELGVPHEHAALAVGAIDEEAVVSSHLHQILRSQDEGPIRFPFGPNRTRYKNRVKLR